MVHLVNIIFDHFVALWAQSKNTEQGAIITTLLVL